MISLLASFFSSCIATLLLIRFQNLHGHLTSDIELSGPQKFHTGRVPRIGGIAIAIGLLAAEIIRLKHPFNNIEFKLLISAIPVFAIGLLEDITKKISVQLRLFFTSISGAIFIYLLDIQITRIGIPMMDSIFMLPPISLIFTIFAITGLANSYNIIDGFNGLSSMIGILALLAIAYIGLIFADQTIFNMSLIMVAAILGFFVWNYPKGLIFLGDGGAYLIGFWVAILSTMAVQKHSEISPWFAISINGYPIFETIFTIYRRKFRHNKGIGQPDGMHFHSLIYRRVIINKNKGKDWLSANSRTAPYLWILATTSIAPGVIWFQSTPILVTSFLIYALAYVWLYYKLVKFKIPKFFFS